MAGNPKTLFEKVWESHVVAEPAGEPTLLYIDLHLIHEVTSPQAFAVLRERGSPNDVGSSLRESVVALGQKKKLPDAGSLGKLRRKAAVRVAARLLYRMSSSPTS
jgi:hypothetical protein